MPPVAASWNVGLVKDKRVKSIAETHLSFSVALHSCGHSEFPPGSLMNTFMIHDHYFILSWHICMPSIIRFHILHISTEQQPGTVSEH